MLLSLPAERVYLAAPLVTCLSHVVRSLVDRLRLHVLPLHVRTTVSFPGFCRETSTQLSGIRLCMCQASLCLILTPHHLVPPAKQTACLVITFLLTSEYLLPLAHTSIRDLPGPNGNQARLADHYSTTQFPEPVHNRVRLTKERRQQVCLTPWEFCLLSAFASLKLLQFSHPRGKKKPTEGFLTAVTDQRKYS